MIRRFTKVFAIGGLLLATNARALDFDYVKIADTSTVVPDGGSGLFGLFQQPALSGYTVAFRGNKAPVGGGSLGKDALYVSTGGTLTQIASITTAIPAGSGTFNAFGDPSPSGGSVAFSGTNNASPTGIYNNVGGLNRVADFNTPIPSGTGNFTSFGAATSLDSGNTLFFGQGASGQQGFYSTAGELHAVANLSTPIPGGTGNFTSFNTSATASGGTIAFTGLGTGQWGVYTSPASAGGPLHVVADKTTLTPQAPVTFSGFGAPSSSYGNVAFYASAQTAAQADGVYYADGGGLHAVADDATPVPGGTGNFTALGITPSLSNGSVAFYGTGVGLTGVFTNYGGTLSPVITNGMLLDSKKVTGFYGSVGIGLRANNNGNVAFYTSFSDGSSGIYVAELSYDYAANTSGTWDAATNWSFGLKPRTTVYTNIHPDTGTVVTGPSSPTTIRGLDLGASYSGQAELRLQSTGQLTVNEFATVESLGKLNVNGGVVTTGYGLYNYGEVDLGGGQIAGSYMQNNGTLHGSGTIGDNLDNYATIQAINAAQHYVGHVYNDNANGRIDVRNSLLQFDGGLSNNGSLNFSFGTSDVFGHIDNGMLPPATPTGKIVVSGNSSVTFYDAVVHNGSLFQVSTGSTVVFFGPVSGAGAFTGSGTKFFEGGYSPGNSPASVSLDGPVTFGDTNTLKIELGGTTAGAQYDKVNVAGQLTLGGTLQVSLINGFKPKTGNSFDILNWTTLGGTFATVQLPDLGGRIAWDSSHLYDTGALGGTISVQNTFYAGDVNRDSLVDASDVPALMGALSNLSKYQTTTGLDNPHLLLVANLTNDNLVNNLDVQGLITLLANGLGSGGGSLTTVPEPSALALAAIATIAAISLMCLPRHRHKLPA